MAKREDIGTIAERFVAAHTALTLTIDASNKLNAAATNLTSVLVSIGSGHPAYEHIVAAYRSAKIAETQLHEFCERLKP